MILLSKKYILKIQSCKKAIRIFDVNRDHYIEKYKNINFKNSHISKIQTFLNLLNQDIEQETKDFLNNRCDKLLHFKDHRSGYEYAIDLMLGWLIEDAVLFYLKQFNIIASADGADAQREFLKAGEISSNSDIKIYGEYNKNLEVFCDWQGTWSKWNHADFRDNKFKKMEKTNALILGISPKDQKGFLLDVSKDTIAFRFNSAIKGYGGKPGYTISNIKHHLFPLKTIKEKLQLLRV